MNLRKTRAVAPNAVHATVARTVVVRKAAVPLALVLATCALWALLSPEPGWAQNQQIFTDGFESGDLAAWSKVRKKKGLDVNTAAAHDGQFGLEVRSGRGRTGVEERSPRNEDDILVDLFFSPNNTELIVKRSGSVDILQLLDKGKKVAVVRLLLRQPQADRFELRLLARDNNGRFRFVGSGEARRNEWTRVSFAWVQGGTNGFDRGFVTFSTNGVVRGERTNLDNDEFNIDTIRLGLPKNAARMTSGSFYLDTFSSFRTLAP